MQKVRQLWFTHTRLVRDNPAYLAAVTAGAASVLSQDSLTDLLAAVTAMVLAVAAATRRALSRC
jgi:hypothetical protein